MDAVRLLGSLLGSNATGGNVLSGLLKQSGGGQGGSPLGALGGLMGTMMGGNSPSSGSTGGILGTLAKAAMGSGSAPAAAQAGSGGLLGALMGVASSATAERPEIAAPEVADEATLLIRAMCNAAKADGQVDAAEQQNILGRLGDVSDDEREFVQRELSSPLDLEGFAQSVPTELAPQVYALSVMTVRVDTPQEAKYLNDLGRALNIDNQTLGDIHKQLGVASE